VTLSFGSLFAGIGGFDLGLERAGMVCKWQVEIEPYAQAVLKKHWPNVARHADVRTFPPEGEWGVDVICGGFPCQDISAAGPKDGLRGERSGLWNEYARIISRIRPRYVIVENVAALLARGMDAVLGTLSTLGYDAEWHCIPAAYAGSPIGREGRDRVWIVADANGGRFVGPWLSRSIERELVAEPRGSRVARGRRSGSVRDCWQSEPAIRRVDHGVPSRVDRLRCLGNAVVPQIVEIIGRAIIERERVMK
jgi:DNA (cytosine-5)-methyltransferase 1